MRPLTRRGLALGGIAGALAGCSGRQDLPLLGSLLQDWPRDGVGPVRSPDYARVYGPVKRERFPVPAFDYTLMDPAVLRSDVAYRGREPAGTIVVQPSRHVLYLVEAGGRATRYGVAIGPEGLAWAGTAEVAALTSWPSKAGPGAAAAAWSGLRMAGRRSVVPDRPGRALGARLIALSSAERAVGYGIHGTPWPETVGSDVSVGCVAMIDQDIIHLAGRVAPGTAVVVLA